MTHCAGAWSRMETHSLWLVPVEEDMASEERPGGLRG